MQSSPEKTGRSLSSEQDARFDFEIHRKEKENYRAFAKKVAETNEDKNAVVSYPIHWQFSDIKDRKIEMPLAAT
jgi:hypothetical protein